VIDHQADVGIALDGDADRLIMVDENSQIVDGDTILGICAKDFKKKGVLKNDVVVSTVMCNLGFVKSMEDAGIRVVKSPVGDRYVIQRMIEEGASLGGEQSGHMICLDHNTTGDGIVSALQVLRIMIETESKLSDLAASIKKYPQALLNVKIGSKPRLETLPKTNQAIKKAQELLGDQGFVLARYSGTEPILRITVQGPKQKQVHELASSIAKCVQEEIG
jgi:phosphoglucosamine mutase